MIPHIINRDNGQVQSITLFANGEPYSLTPDHVNYDEIYELLVSGEATDDIWQLCDVPTQIRSKINGTKLSETITLKDDTFYYNEYPVHNSVCDLILEYIKNGYIYDHLVKFLDNLMQNESNRSLNLAFEYLQRYKMPITPDGCFIAMKAVRNDFKDKYSGEIDNSVGQVVEMPRNQISDDFRSAYSTGLHAGFVNYVRSYGGDDDQIIFLKINPKDIVSIPEDCSFQKMRVCKYEVISSKGTHKEFFSKERQDFESSSASNLSDD